ncbi:MAG TPA: DsrE family protein [Burkholderiaceae bacterium]|nr:DsrE family protein [Burkholderiaceae bacterium]
MAKLLVHVTSGPENPTKAALAFLVAKTAADAGHDVTVFVAGDAAQLMRNAVLDNLVGIGTGKLRESYDALAAKGVRFYVSGMSAKARGMTDADLQGKPAEFAMPDRLVQLTLEADRTLVY